MSGYEQKTIHATSKDGSIEGTFTYRGGAFDLTGLALAKHHCVYNVAKAHEDDTDALREYLDAIYAEVRRRRETSSYQSKAAKLKETDSEKQVEASVEKPANKPQLAYKIKKAVFDEIHQKIGRHKPELGGMLGGSRKDRTISHFFFDAKADTSSVTYSPDAKTLNDVVKEWNDAGIDLIGMVHSHPGNFTRPSGGDEVYANAFLQVCEDMDAFFMPIIRSEINGGFEMKGYIFSRHPTGNRLAPIDYRIY